MNNHHERGLLRIQSSTIEDTNLKRQERLNAPTMCLRADMAGGSCRMDFLFTYFAEAIEAEGLRFYGPLGGKYLRNAIVHWIESGHDFETLYYIGDTLVMDQWVSPAGIHMKRKSCWSILTNSY